MNQLITIILISIANWRISYMLQYEEGPFNIFGKFREMIGLTNVDDLPINEQLLYPEDAFIHNGNFFAKLTECIYCLSIWVGFFISLYLGLTKMIKKPYIPIYTLVSSALTIVISNNFKNWSNENG